MDFHIFSEISIAEVKNAHIADKAIQDNFGVKYHQFWVNENAGTVFCLMEGPDKETCARVHAEAHGNVACEIVEVERGFYDLLMGKSHKIDHGLVRHEDGTLDSGLRTIMVLEITGTTNISGPNEYKKLRLPEEPRQLAFEKIRSFQGEKIDHIEDDSIIAVFIDANNALKAGLAIQSALTKRMAESDDNQWNINFKIGLCCGQPVTEKDGFFAKTLRTARRFSFVAAKQQMVVSTSLKKAINVQQDFPQSTSLKMMDPSDEQFLNELFDAAETKLSESDFNVQALGRTIGFSRPQLYRKTLNVTGRSPNQFMRALKMQKAFTLLMERKLSISEIAYTVGYNNPSYFSKCFFETFGVSPSRVA